MAKLVRRVFQRGSPDTQSQSLMPDLPDEFYLEEDLSESRYEKYTNPIFLVFELQVKDFEIPWKTVSVIISSD